MACTVLSWESYHSLCHSVLTKSPASNWGGPSHRRKHLCSRGHFSLSIGGWQGHDTSAILEQSSSNVIVPKLLDVPTRNRKQGTDLSQWFLHCGDKHDRVYWTHFLTGFPDDTDCPADMMVRLKMGDWLRHDRNPNKINSLKRKINLIWLKI
jgi:hypothetical protein